MGKTLYRLDWDSEFWDVEIFNVDKNYNFSIPNLNKKNINKSKSWLIQALIPENKVETINLLENKGFRFVESKIYLKKILKEKAKINTNEFKDIEHRELKKYKNDFFDLYGQFSRFSLFSKEKINDFYYIWLIKSIDGKMDDKCIGYYIESELAGFITFKYKNTGLSIGLVGVFPEFHRRGISQKLLDYVNNQAINERYYKIYVSTQGKNYNAINAYIKNGYIIENIQNWYYLKGENHDIIQCSTFRWKGTTIY